jgi:SulP family sulfate permease
MMAGVLLIVMGMTGLGSLVRYIPVSIVIGFTNGIAVLIALSQIKDLFGLKFDPVPAEFFAKVSALLRHITDIDPYAASLSLVSLVIVAAWPKSYAANDQAWRRWVARVPGTIVAMILGTVAVSVFHLDVETIGSKFGGIPQSLPGFQWPNFSWEGARQLFAPTITIALLCAVESLLCARVADSLTDDRHDPNQELVAQGLANIAAPLFGGFCATGTIARTVTNIRSGARTPIAGIIHALTILIVVVALAPLAADIPLASLAAILMVVAYNMGEWRQFARMRRFSNNYRAILLATFLLTVIIDLTVAVEVGLALACLFFITRVSSLTKLDPIANDSSWLAPNSLSVEAYSLNGSLFFGSVGVLETIQNPRRAVPKVTVLDLSGLLNMDTTGLEALEGVHGLLHKQGGHLILAGLHGQPQSLVRRSGFEAALGPNGIADSLVEAGVIIGRLARTPSQDEIIEPLDRTQDPV